MNCSSGQPPRRRHLKDLVAEYISRFRPERRRTIAAYTALSDNQALVQAGNLQVPRKQGDRWKRHPHFHRSWFYSRWRDSFVKAGQRLLAVREQIAAAVASDDPFQRVLDLVTLQIEDIDGLGVLAAYDMTELICFHYRVEPTFVHLHAGTLEGARRLRPDAVAASPQRVHKSVFDGTPLVQLSSAEIEDFLCIYKDQLPRGQR